MSNRPDLTAALRDWLLADADIVGVIGHRLRPDGLEPEELLPAVAYTVLFDRPYQNNSGRASMSEARIEYTAYASTRNAADGLGRMLEARLEAAIVGVTSPRIDDLVIDNSYGRRDNPPKASDAWRYLRRIDAVTNYQAIEG
ncbi:MAG: hypothetical protein AAGJ46_12170 [Planctomycetota bacterium]